MPGVEATEGQCSCSGGWGALPANLLREIFKALTSLEAGAAGPDRPRCLTLRRAAGLLASFSPNAHWRGVAQSEVRGTQGLLGISMAQQCGKLGVAKPQPWPCSHRTGAGALCYFIVVLMASALYAGILLCESV